MTTTWQPHEIGPAVLEHVLQLVELFDAAKAAELPVMPVAALGVANVGVAGFVLCQAVGITPPTLALLDVETPDGFTPMRLAPHPRTQEGI